jgi:hypothetical protein
MTTFQDDDELDALPAAKTEATTKTTTTPPTTATATTATATPRPAPAAMDEDLDVDFGDEKITSYSDGLEKVNPEKGKSIRFSLLTDMLKAKAAYTHYVENGEKKGSYRCLRPTKGTLSEQPICCTKLDESYLYVVALVLLYTNADQKGGLPTDSAKNPIVEWKVGFVKLGRGVFRTISELVSEDAEESQDKVPVEMLDIKMTRLANNKFEVKRVNKKAIWRRNPELVAEVTAALTPFKDGKKLESKLGRKLDNLGYKALFASTSVKAEEADLSDVDSL